MKNLPLLLFVIAPFFNFGQCQQFMEIYAASNYTDAIVSVLSNEKGKLGYHFGFALGGSLKNNRLYWLAGLQPLAQNIN